MTENQWNAFSEFREEYKNLCDYWSMKYSQLLKPLQKEAAEKSGVPPYPIENPVVYNTDYDRINCEDEITMIVIGDNPGKDEQLSKNCRYLVGQSGKIAEGFFKRNPEFKTDFRKNVVICNKTPVHSAKTQNLKMMAKNGGEEIKKLLEESQVKMAELIARLHHGLAEGAGKGGIIPELWLVGYAELKDRGLFLLYREELKKNYSDSKGSFDSLWERVLVLQHFSMNRFLVDLKKFRESNKELSITDSVDSLGKIHREEIFCS